MFRDSQRQVPSAEARPGFVAPELAVQTSGLPVYSFVSAVLGCAGTGTGSWPSIGQAWNMICSYMLCYM